MTNDSMAHEVKIADRELPVGTVLSGDQFTITGHLGEGGFGITYRAKDNVLGRTIVIKECFPEDFCVRQGKNVVARNKSYTKPVRSIVKMFMREARSLALLRHKNVVGVHRAFEENETAYMAIDLIDGHDLFRLITAGAKPLSPARVKDILLQLLDAIEKVHQAGLLHRDISPDNIIIEKNGTPVLIDFGAARGDASRQTRAVSSLLVVKDGYSPQEFYTAGSEQSPSSDLYALGATFYHVLSGEAPVNSQTRMIELAGKRPDPCIPLAGRIEGYDDEFLQAIDSAMQIHPGDRLQSAAKWRSLISGPVSEAKLAPYSQGRLTSADLSLELELSLTKLVEETNDEVRRTALLGLETEKEEAATPPAEPTSRPEWVDEFNQESMSPKSGKLRIRSRSGDSASTRNVSNALSVPASMDQASAETNWIGRAFEKQARIRSERERELDLFEANGDKRINSTSTPSPAEPHYDAAQDAEIARPNNRSLRILFGLLICFCVAAYLQLP